MGSTGIFKKKVVASPTNYKNRQSRLAQKRSRLPGHDGMSPQSVAKPFLTAQFLQLSLFNNVQIQNFDCNSSESVTPPEIPFHGAENLDSEASLRSFRKKTCPETHSSLLLLCQALGFTTPIPWRDPTPHWAILAAQNQNTPTKHPYDTSIQKRFSIFKTNLSPHPLNLLTYITAALFLFQHDLHLQNGGHPYWHITHMC